MEIETRSGVYITVNSENPSKIVSFNKPIRAVELTQHEALQIGTLLMASVKARTNVKAKNFSLSKMKITLCGSMKFLKQMKEIKQILEKRGHKVETPPLIDPSVLRQNSGDEQEFLKIKSIMMRSHLENIRSSDAVLILNCSNDANENYIGANTLLEIGVAFDNYKPIFLLNDPPKNIEEIRAMNPRVIGGLKNVKDFNGPL